MEFADAVGSRRMSRSFSSAPVDPAVFSACVAAATRAPSAGKTQGWNLVVLEGPETARYWDVALPAHRRESFAFPGLLRAPIVAIVTADPRAYLARYSEPDKIATGLGASAESWPAPYWTVDASFATMVLLLALEDAGLGASFVAHAAEEAVRAEFGIPDEVQILGIVCIGHPDGADRKGRSAARRRRTVDEVVRRGRW